MIFLCLVWGSSFILIKKSLIAFDYQQVGLLRIGISALVFLPFIFRELKKVKSKEWRFIIIAALSGNGFPAFLYPLAQTHIDSGLAGLLNSLTPVFTFVLGLLFFGVVFKWQKLVGVLIGLCGAAILILFGKGIGVSENIQYALYAVAATIFYATSVNVVGAHLKHLNTLTINVACFSIIGVPALVYLFSTDVVEVVTTHPSGWNSLFYVSILAIFGTVISSLLFYRLVQITNALFASTVAYMIPIVALGWAAFDGEVITIFHFIGMILILLGVYLAKK